jgi:hypothetical protein
MSARHLVPQRQRPQVDKDGPGGSRSQSGQVLAAAPSAISREQC